MLNIVSVCFKTIEISRLTKVAAAARSVVSIVPVFSGSKSGYLPVAGQSLEL